MALTGVEEDDLTDGNSRKEKGSERMGMLWNFATEVRGCLNRHEHEQNGRGSGLKER